MIRRRAGEPAALAQLEPRADRSFVEDLPDLDTAGEELLSRSLDVGHDQVQALGRPGRRRCELGAELDRAPGARRRELDDPEAVVEGEVGVEPPTEAAVELLRAIDVRHRNHDDLELQVDGSRGGTFSRRLIVSLGTAHLDLPGAAFHCSDTPNMPLLRAIGIRRRMGRRHAALGAAGRDPVALPGDLREHRQRAR